MFLQIVVKRRISLILVLIVHETANSICMSVSDRVKQQVNSPVEVPNPAYRSNTAACSFILQNKLWTARSI